MKRQILTTSLVTGIALITTISSVLAIEGGNSSGGGDLLPEEHGSAWFLGNQPVKYCLDVAPDFGMTASQSQPVIAKVIQEWKSYVAERINYDINRTPEAHRLNFNYELMPACDGSQDLVFHLGTNNAKLDELRTHFVNPSFFAHRDTYDRHVGRGKGVIWIAGEKSVNFGQYSPHWTPELLRPVLLHELGHILGCAHIEGTIMTERIAGEFHPFYTIDEDRMLIPGLPTRRQRSARLRSDVLKKFLGTDPEPKATTYLELVQTAWDDEQQRPRPLILKTTLISGQQQREVLFETNPEIDESGRYGFPMSSGYDASGPSIFKTVYREHVISHSPMGFVTYGTIKSEQGTYPAVLEINMNSATGKVGSGPGRRSIALYFFDGGKRQALFL